MGLICVSRLNNIRISSILDNLKKDRDGNTLESNDKQEYLRTPNYVIEYPLYRYRSRIQWVTDEIRTGEIYLSQVDKQNDPFDSTYAITRERVKEEKHYFNDLLLGSMLYWKKYRAELSKLALETKHELISIDEFVKKIAKYLLLSENQVFQSLEYYLSLQERRHENAYKIACFSESKSSIPMWAYYANNHEGVCLEYDVRKLPKDLHKLKEAFCKIHYSDYRPQDLYGTYSLVVKSSQWAHEHEWRLICKTQENYIKVPCLSAVYLGLRFDARKVGDIISAIKENGSNIKLYTCVACQDRYDLKYKEIII